MNNGQVIEIKRLSDDHLLYTGLNSFNHGVARENPSAYECRLVKYQGPCIYSNINARAHDGFEILIDGIPVKEFLDSIEKEDECYTFFD